MNVGRGRASRTPRIAVARLAARLAVSLIVGLVAGLAVAACGAQAPAQPVPAFPAGATGVTIAGLRFSPSALEVSAGTTVAWVNADLAAHDVVADDGTFTSPTLQQGGVWTWTFPSPGAWTYHCSVHPEMTGTVAVR